ncbi:hypothetical protein [Geodermatophilus maliterrae]|uniref:Uncharacterized protein n=1 Tax=Geodermatophilus maliterrae TaxID=3162531 RepID=A0ABV3XB54_9ACTN
MHSALRRHLGELGRATRVVEGTPADRWGAATPCPDGPARQPVGHLREPPGPPVGESRHPARGVVRRERR